MVEYNYTEEYIKLPEGLHLEVERCEAIMGGREKIAVLA